VIALLWSLVAGATEPPVVEVLAEWAQRATTELEIEGLRPQRTVVGAYARTRYGVVGELGSLYNEAESVGRPGVAEVILGDDQLNSSRFTARTQRSMGARRYPNFVVEDVPLALARDLWLTTDASFKAAAQRYPQKQAALAQLASVYPPDWTAAPAVVHHESIGRAALDKDALRRLAVEGSAAFLGYEGLRNGWVEVSVERGDMALVDSDGLRLTYPVDQAVIYAWCDAVRPDGVQVYEERTWLAADPSELPALDVVKVALTEMAERVRARVGAEIVDDYEGPVLFEGEAAAQLLYYLAAAEFEATPPEPKAGVTWEQLVRGGPRVGRRLLPEGWTVWDDPTALPLGAVGRYSYDLEGVPAQRVDLVHDGRVVDLLRSRVPLEDGKPSNGHARGAIQGMWEARVAALTVIPPRLLPEAAVLRAADRAARSAEVPALLVVRALQRGRPGALPRVMDAVWRFPDGHEAPVVSLQFQYANRRLLKDILAAGGGMSTRTWLASTTKSGTDGTSLGLPTWLMAPRLLLVDDLEATFPGADRRPDAYPMPPLRGGGADR
jgi:hypothetical protein